MTEIKPGQIWREVDPRFVRCLRVERMSGTADFRSVLIQTVIKTDAGWEPAPGSRKTWAMAERFRGGRGGYELVEDALG